MTEPVVGLPVTNTRRANRVVESPQSVSTPTWAVRYIKQLRWMDLGIVSAAVGAACYLRFGADGLMDRGGAVGAPAVLVSVALIIAWVIALFAGQCYDKRFLGNGPQEYSRVLTSCLWVFGLLAILDLLFRLNIARGFLAFALPVGTLGLLLSRIWFRRRLVRRRMRSEALDRILVVGTMASAQSLARRLVRNPALGFHVTGIWLRPEHHVVTESSIVVESQIVPIYTGREDIAAVVAQTGAQTVAISMSDEFAQDSAVRELSWQLDAFDVDILVSPSVADVTGPRIMMRQVDGLPLLHIDRPRYGAAKSLMKSGLDYFCAMLVLLVVAPIMVVVAAAIKIDDRGPVFFKQPRVGKDGKVFSVWKFRSMSNDADKLKSKLHESLEGERRLFFKSENDPRVTRVGRYIRKTSLDELPQLFNVLRSEMSLVGPRPLVVGEGSEIPNFVERRLLVKPGITGLWQVSGRSDLSDEDRIRLDLVYVENWSLMQDLAILWRTIQVVLTKDGAY